MIRKFPGQNKWGIYSIKTGKRLGVYPSKKKAKIRLKEIEYFKHR